MQELGGISNAEMHEVFNMGLGLCAIVAADHAGEAENILGDHHPGTARIGRVTGEGGQIRVPALGLRGARDGLRAA